MGVNIPGQPASKENEARWRAGTQERRK